MANLPVNFTDDILASSMNGKRRYKMIENGDGTVSFEDVSEYDQVGSNFGAAQINQTNDAVNNAADSLAIIPDLDTISALQEYGYLPDAMAVKELNSKLTELESQIESTPEALSGTTSFYAIGGGNSSCIIAFEKPFSNIPTVNAVASLDTGRNFDSTTVKDITKSGFTVVVTSTFSAGNTAYVKWHASV